MLHAKVTYLGLWLCWRGKNRERGKILNTGRCKLTSRVKIPTEESINSREVVGVLLGILRDELHEITEVFLWGTIPGWQQFRQVHPAGLGHLWLWISGVRAPRLLLRKMTWGPPSPFWSRECPPTLVVPEAEQAWGLLGRIVWAYWFYPYKYLFLFIKSLYKSNISISCCHQINLDIFSWFYSLFRKQYCWDCWFPTLHLSHLVSTSSTEIEAQGLTGHRAAWNKDQHCPALLIAASWCD